MDLEKLQVALFAAYDIRNVLPTKIKEKPCDNDGTSYTIGESLDDVIDFLEQQETELTQGAKQMKVTKEQLMAWLGSDATKDTLIELLLEIANGEYDPDTMRFDISLYEGEIK